MAQILLVDDEPNILKSLERMLRAWDTEYDVMTATSGAEAMAFLEGGSIDVVVSDVRMPGMDGIELLTRIRASDSFRNIPVLMLTGLADASMRRMAIELGAIDFVNKPPDPDEFAARLRSALRMKAFEDRLVEQNRILGEQVVLAQRMEFAVGLAAGASHDLKRILAMTAEHARLTAMSAEEAGVQDGLLPVTEAAEHALRLLRHIVMWGQEPHDRELTCDVTVVIE